MTIARSTRIGFLVPILSGAPFPKSLWFRPAVAGSVGCFSRRVRSAHPAPFLLLACMAIFAVGTKMEGDGPSELRVLTAAVKG